MSAFFLLFLLPPAHKTPASQCRYQHPIPPPPPGKMARPGRVIWERALRAVQSLSSGGFFAFFAPLLARDGGIRKRILEGSIWRWCARLAVVSHTMFRLTLRMLLTVQYCFSLFTVFRTSTPRSAWSCGCALLALMCLFEMSSLPSRLPSSRLPTGIYFRRCFPSYLCLCPSRSCPPPAPPILWEPTNPRTPSQALPLLGHEAGARVLAAVQLYLYADRRGH